jgi:hypothetical protein
MEVDLKILIALSLVIACTLTVFATPQKSRTTRTRRRPAPAAPQPAPDLRAEANKVAEQLKLVTQFVYVYGKLANGLEIAADQVRRGETSAELTARNKQIRDGIVNNIAGLRAGIDKLAATFHTNPRLQVQYLKLTGASDAVAQAGQMAGAGRYNEAGTSLVTAVERLAETIIALR